MGGFAVVDSGPEKVDKLEDLLAAIENAPDDKLKFLTALKHVHLPESLWHVADILSRIPNILSKKNQEHAQAFLTKYVEANFSTCCSGEDAKDRFKSEAAFRLDGLFHCPRTAAEIAVTEASKNKAQVTQKETQSNEVEPKAAVKKR